MQLLHTNAWRTIALTAALVGSSWLVGQAQAADDDAAEIDPKAEKVLRVTADYFQKVKGARVNVDWTLFNENNGKRGKAEQSYRLTMERPNLLVATVVSGDQALSVICDGKKLYTIQNAANEYTVEDAPSSMDRIVGKAGVKHFHSLHGMTVLTSLMAAKPYEALLDGVQSVAYLGSEDLEGIKCHHLRFTREALNWDLWVDAGDKPLVHKIAPDIMTLMKKQGADIPASVKLELAIAVKNWTIDPALADATFAINLPKGAEKVGSLFPEHPLLDRKAPPITLSQLSGGTFKLANYKDKNIVILDFWATWCGPCVKAMPILAEVAAKYKSKGVVLYAVNLEEKPEEVAAFLKENKLDVSVILDSDGEVSKTYGVEGIPQSVIIDKEGVVRVVHVGIAPNFKDQLTKELDAILAGKNPSEEKE
jgi:peroxiredoxin